VYKHSEFLFDFRRPTGSLVVYRPFGAFVLVTDICFLPTSFFHRLDANVTVFKEGDFRLRWSVVLPVWLFSHQFVSLSCLSASLSVWLFIHQFVCLYRLRLLFYLSGCSPISLSAYLFCLLVYLLAVYPPVCLPILSVS
jgi:hypothetical protein